MDMKTEAQYYAKKLDFLKKELKIDGNMTPKQQFEIYENIARQNPDLMRFLNMMYQGFMEMLVKSNISRDATQAMNEFMDNLKNEILEECEKECKKH